MTTRSYSATLYPLLRWLNAERRLPSGKLGMRHVTEHGCATASNLAALVHVSAQATSLAASVFERLGFSVPVFAGADSPRAMIGFTDAGRQKLVRKFSASHERLDRTTAERLMPGEAEASRGVHPHPRKLAIGAPVD